MYRDQVVKKPSGDTVPLINNRVGFREHGFPLSSQQFICTGSFLTEYSHIGGFFTNYLNLSTNKQIVH